MRVSHPGITYTHLVDDTPLSMHVIKADPNLCSVLPIRALDSGLGRECLTSIAARYNALAAINGGYFLIGGPFDGKSQGALKIGKHWFASPLIDCSSVAWNCSGNDVKMSRIAILWQIKIASERLPLDDFNVPLKSGKAVLYTSALHRTTLSSPGTLELGILDGSITFLGKGNSPIPHDGFIYAIAPDHPLASHPFEVGMKVEISHRVSLLDEEFRDAKHPPDIVDFWQQSDYILSGAPLLIQDGILTEEYSHDILKEFIMYSPQPRSAVGVTDRGEWLFVVVEGRQPGVSVGVTVQELADIMEGLGCVNAMNLDGGASCLMVVEGQLVNKPIFNGIEGALGEMNQRRISDAFVIVPKNH